MLTAGWAGSVPVPGTALLPPGGLRDLAAHLAVVGELGGVVVGGDTGPVRLATAVGTRAVAPLRPDGGRALRPRPARRGLAPGLPRCEVRRPLAITEQVCWSSARCPLTRGDPACLADLSVDAVVAAALGPRERSRTVDREGPPPGRPRRIGTRTPLPSRP